VQVLYYVIETYNIIYARARYIQSDSLATVLRASRKKYLFRLPVLGHFYVGIGIGSIYIWSDVRQKNTNVINIIKF